MNRFSELCSGRYFIIPSNQRGYSWDVSNVEDIFSDLELAHTSHNAHYMGPVIVSRTRTTDFPDDDLVTTAEFTLEDGQQRLTTFFIIVNEIKLCLELLDGSPSLDSQELDKLIYYKRGTKKARLQNSNPSLDQYLLHILTGSPPPAGLTPPMVALKSVAEYIHRYFSGLDRSNLIIWKLRITNQAKFIFVDLLSEGVNRYLTFDAINARGLPLSEFDKIKNFCLLVDQERELRTSPEDMWYRAIAQLQKFDVSSRSEEAAFIADLYSTFHDESVGQQEVHAKFVKRYHKLVSTSDVALENDLKSFIALWEEYAKSFGFITTGNRSMYYGTMCSIDAGAWLDRLDNMGLSTITRPLLTTSHLRMTQEDFYHITTTCEIYTFRVHGVMKYRKDSNSRQIIKLSNEILRLAKNYAYAANQICSWLDRLAPLSQVIIKLANGEAKYNYDPKIKGWSHSYYFLYEYEVYNSPSGVRPLPWASTEILKMNTQEHILPQSHRDGGWWQSHWPNEADAEKFKHRLGNIVLTTGNSILNRKPFHAKLNDTSSTYYYNCRQATNSEKRIANFTNGADWKPRNIIKREFELITFASDRWSIPCYRDNGTIDLPAEFISEEGAPLQITINKATCYGVPTEETEEFEENPIGNHE